MLATPVDEPERWLDDPAFAFERKYDGIRVLVEIRPAPATRPSRRRARADLTESGTAVRLWSRLGNEKTAQFPETTRALARAGGVLDAPILADGELVALDKRGRPASFQRLQGRMHLTRDAEIARASAGQPVALILFDLLWHGDEDLRGRPWTERRARLERVCRRLTSRAVRLSEVARKGGRALYRRAVAEAWEGLVAKRLASPYRSGKRSSEWLKLKIGRRQEFVIGGWTEPRGSRSHFGALLLGVYESRASNPESRRLIHVGHTGSGFSQAELERVFARLKPLETAECPFASKPRTNERPHWVRPELVAEVKFTEWTSDGLLRHPIYLGLRDDVRPKDVGRESPAGPRSPRSPKPTAFTRQSGLRASPARRARRRQTRSRGAAPESRNSGAVPAGVIDQLQALEEARKDGAVLLPDGFRLQVTNLSKVFWPDGRITKGELMRYYARVAPDILPAVADRPLVMRRHPNGIGGHAFYQQRAPEQVPPGVRVERLEGDDVPSRLVGGSLHTLLYMAQLAVISQDPWFSRVQSPEHADYAALDLDPMPGVPFGRVLDVARWIRDELEALGVPGVPKTSGADGLHIYIPLPPGTPYAAGLIFCQIIATIVAHRHPKIATVERSVGRRGATVYIDYLQNVVGKTLATAYSARASEFAGVSMPLEWSELDDPIDPRDFTIRTVPDRLRRTGDLWARLRTGKTTDLTAVLKYAEPGPGRVVEASARTGSRTPD